MIIIFSAHAYAEKDFIEKNIEALSSEDILCAGGIVKTINETEVGKGIALAISSTFGTGSSLLGPIKNETFVDTVSNGAYLKSVFEKVGYFDEELLEYQAEEFNMRLIKNGYKIIFSPKIKSYNYCKDSYKELWKQYFTLATG